jgi:hypothetical protein
MSWHRRTIWSDEGRVKGPESRRIELVLAPDGRPLCFELVTLWDGVPIRRRESRRQPVAPNRHGVFVSQPAEESSR